MMDDGLEINDEIIRAAASRDNPDHDVVALPDDDAGESFEDESIDDYSEEAIGGGAAAGAGGDDVSGVGVSAGDDEGSGDNDDDYYYNEEEEEAPGVAADYSGVGVGVSGGRCGRKKLLMAVAVAVVAAAAIIAIITRGKGTSTSTSSAAQQAQEVAAMIIGPTSVDSSSYGLRRRMSYTLDFVGDEGIPAAAFPLGECQGECDSDDDCQGTLICYERGQTESVPGCAGVGIDRKDYCANRPSDYLRYVTKGIDPTPGSLGLCTGDCDLDIHCAEGLICYQRDSYTPVPGCDGDGRRGTDYCIPDPVTGTVMDLCTEDYPTLDLSEAYQPLHMPPQVYPDEDGVTRLDLVWNLAYYQGPSFSTIIRNFNGGFPGPTIHVAQGGRLELKHVNCMYPPLGFSGPESHNRYHLPNSTNLHTHGPHISAAPPGDDVFLKIGPREYFDYMYEFDDNHMPGTFWYHPHLHGATALQTGSGSSGMLIMDDPEDYDIPAAIKKMPDVQIVFQHMNLQILRDSANVSQDMVTNWIDHNFEITNKTTDLTNIMLANMQFLPKITMEQGKWYRWRMVMSSIQVGIAFVSESENCEMKLLAKDGIYLTDAPRDVEAVILSAGNRADVAIRCQELGQEYMNATAIDIRPGFGGFDPGDQYPQEGEEDPPVDEVVGTFVDPELQPTILVIDVVPNQDVQDDDIEPFTTPTPCYLVDLTGVDESEIDPLFTVEYSCVNNSTLGWPRTTTPLDICGVWGPYGVGGNSSEFTPWVDEDTYINDFATGTVQELEHPGNAFHPYHQHINPYQISFLGGTLNPIAADWYKVGDWHDTLQLPLARFGPTGRPRMRFQADQFTGHMVQHCHLLFHEDQGMMAQYDVTGEEGAVWPGSKLIDPQCISAN